MKPEESVKNYPATLRMYTNYAVREVKKICKTIGPRASGSENERKAQEHFAEEMRTCADKVTVEDFNVHPIAFMSWVVIDGIFMLIGLVFSLLGMPAITLGLSAIGIVCMVTEFLMYLEFLDPLFPKKTSCNSVGRRTPTGEIKQRIIFSGHTDSAFEWTYTHLGGKNLLFTVGGIGIAGMIFVFVVSLLTVIKYGAFNVDPEGIYNVLRYVQLVFAPGFVAVIFFTNFKLPVMGANDNLTGAATAVAVLKFLEDNNITFEHTEVVAVTTGCEEAGLRGAKAFTKKHIDELNEVPSVFFGMDTLRDFEDMAIYIRDMTGTIKNDERVCALMKKGAEKAGLDLPYSSVYFGASDAANVSKLGIPAATLAAMNPGPPRYYHTRTDTEDNLVPKTVEKSLDICLQSLFLFDEQGLKKNYD